MYTPLRWRICLASFKALNTKFLQYLRHGRKAKLPQWVWSENYLEMGETMRCCFDNNAFFSPPFCARLAEGAKRLQGNVPPVSRKISSESIPVCRSYSRKSDFIRLQMLSAYNDADRKHKRPEIFHSPDYTNWCSYDINTRQSIIAGTFGCNKCCRD